MRVTADDPGATQAKVYVDGVEVRALVAADDDEGWVDEIVFDANGDFVTTPDGGSMLTRRRYGRVRIHLPGKTTDYMGITKDMVQH